MAYSILRTSLATVSSVQPRIRSITDCGSEVTIFLYLVGKRPARSMRARRVCTNVVHNAPWRKNALPAWPILQHSTLTFYSEKSRSFMSPTDYRCPCAQVHTHSARRIVALGTTRQRKGSSRQSQHARVIPNRMGSTVVLEYPRTCPRMSCWYIRIRLAHAYC